MGLKLGIIKNIRKEIQKLSESTATATMRISDTFEENQESAEEQKMEPLQGLVKLNGSGAGNEIDLSPINSLQAFSGAISSKIGGQALTRVLIGVLDGSKESANMLVKFLA